MWLDWLLRRREQTLGQRGERAAAKYLRRELRMKVLATNVLCPGGELDIVALDGDDLVFVEVRTRTTDDFGLPEASVAGFKQQFLVRSARWFIKTRRLKIFQPRFDVIGITWKPGGKPDIRYYRNVFGMKASRR